MGKKLKIVAIVILIVILGSVIAICNIGSNSEIRTIKSEEQLLKIYRGDNINIKDILGGIFTMPVLIPTLILSEIGTINDSTIKTDSIESNDATIMNGITADTSSISGATTSSKDYSTTNIQVENVDEADIIKTDGDYIYSLSEDNVIITDVRNQEDIKIAATIKPDSGDTPEDLILYGDKLIVILTDLGSYSSKSNTIVEIYDITQKEDPKLVKSCVMYEPYYTSRCINNQLYIISSGNLRKANDTIVRFYKEDDDIKEIALENIKYLKDVETKKQTIISNIDLNNIEADMNINSYLIDISNAYVSENNIYLLNQKYDYKGDFPELLKSMFGLKGITGITDYDFRDNDGYYTEIYKFNIEKNGQVEFETKNEAKGKTINQYSLDEKDEHLRIALYDDDGARVTIFNENLKQIGSSESVAKGEKMYSSRFIGDKLYFVTYKTMDPLFVVDLSDETNPEVLGELKIPGYSTYLHPYDENHLIGIGMETQEVINRNSSGKVLSTTSKVIGMKMALFDVSDVKNPTQISSTVIGDRRATSAILTNPKALLFSKAKSLIAIPVNNYSEDFEVNASDTYSSMVNLYTQYNKKYISEGYFVYNIDVENGFNLKGTITHDVAQSKNGYYLNSRLLRGLYIDNNLYTVSETAVKVNDLESLELINELKIK